MARYGKKHSHDELEVNLVPMMDVLMTVLTFFIVVSMTLTGATGGSVNLPRVKMPGIEKAPSQDEVPKNPLVLQIDAKKSLSIAGKAIEQANLPKTIVEYLQTNPNGAVLLQADRTLSYREVVTLLEELQAMGGDRVMLAYEEGENK